MTGIGTGEDWGLDKTWTTWHFSPSSISYNQLTLVFLCRCFLFPETWLAYLRSDFKTLRWTMRGTLEPDASRKRTWCPSIARARRTRRKSTTKTMNTMTKRAKMSTIRITTDSSLRPTLSRNSVRFPRRPRRPRPLSLLLNRRRQHRRRPPLLFQPLPLLRRRRLFIRAVRRRSTPEEALLVRPRRGDRGFRPLLGDPRHRRRHRRAQECQLVASRTCLWMTPTPLSICPLKITRSPIVPTSRTTCRPMSTSPTTKSSRTAKMDRHPLASIWVMRSKHHFPVYSRPNLMCHFTQAVSLRWECLEVSSSCRPSLRRSSSSSAGEFIRFPPVLFDIPSTGACFTYLFLTK